MSTTAAPAEASGRNAGVWAAVMIVCCVVLSACTSAVPGEASRLGTSLGLPPVPVIPEEPAQWAMSELDPCGLTQDLPINTAEGFYAVRPHSCAADYAPAGATEWWRSAFSDTLYTRVGADIVKLSQLVVHVGAMLDVPDRSGMDRVDIGGRTAYQGYGESFPAPEIDSRWLCRIDFPISADRSVQIVSSAVPDGEMNAACAVPRTVAENVAAKLVSPAGSAHTAPEGLGRWNACDLLQQATGAVVSDRSGRTADECRSNSLTADGEPRPGVEIDTIAGPDSLQPVPYRSELRIDLPFGAAVQNKISDDQCAVRFVAERQPDAPAKFTAHVMTVKVVGSPGDPCADAADAAMKIHNTLSGPAPQPPPAPSHLGFAVGEPDAEMPAACGVFTGLAPDTCRIPVPVNVPATAQDVLKASESLFAADMSCAILRDAAAPVLGDAVELAASANSGGGGCIGLTDHAYALYVGFFTKATADEYCKEAARQEVRVAGRAAVQCAPVKGQFHMYLPAMGTPGTPGVVLMEARLVRPRGDMSWSIIDPHPDAEAGMAAGTTRIAENVINQRLSR